MDAPFREIYSRHEKIAIIRISFSFDIIVKKYSEWKSIKLWKYLNLKNAFVSRVNEISKHNITILFG